MKLFKYVTEERIDILERGYIRFTQPHAFNDPFEFKPHIKSIATNEYLEARLEKIFENLIAEQYDLLSIDQKRVIPWKDFEKFSFLKKDEILNSMPDLLKNALPSVTSVMHSGIENVTGILSLTCKPDNLLMWSHYANSHQGFVIEFDPEDSFFNQEKASEQNAHKLLEVQYSQSRPSVILSELDSFDPFITKGCEWEYEQEWRMMRPLQYADKVIKVVPHDIYLYKLPSAAIKSVILGARMDVRIKERIIELVKSNTNFTGHDIYEMVIHDSKYEVIQVQIA